MDNKSYVKHANYAPSLLVNSANITNNIKSAINNSRSNDEVES